MADEYAPNEHSFIAAPFWPGSYALLACKSPMRDIYPILSRSLSYQKKELELIEVSKPSFAIVVDSPLDGREELKFSNTHLLVYQYIIDDYQ